MAGKDYRTKGTYGLGGQVRIANKNSHVDYDYGAYDSFDDIPQSLYDTVQVGKTIGIVTAGKITEYWWQLQKDGSYGWSVKGVDEEYIKELIAEASTKDKESKEVIGIVGHGETMPELTELTEGNLFINTAENKLYEVVIVSGTKQYEETEPSTEVIYKTLSEESKLFVWNGSEFADVTGEVVGNTIYVNHINELLSKQLSHGVYTIIVGAVGYGNTVLTSIGNQKLQLIKWVRNNGFVDGLKACKELVESIPTTPLNLSEYGYTPTDDDIALFDLWGVDYTIGGATTVGTAYTLIVTSEGRTLENKDGWAIPKIEDNHSVWDWHLYAYEGHTHVIGDVFDDEGEDLSIADSDDVDAELIFPIESDTLKAIVNGEYESEDTEMFSGVSTIRPMTSAEVQSLVQITIAAFNDAREKSE